MSSSATGEIVQKESKGRCTQSEIESEKDQAFEIAQLLSGKRIAAKRQKLCDARRIHFNLENTKITTYSDLHIDLFSLSIVPEVYCSILTSTLKEYS